MTNVLLGVQTRDMNTTAAAARTALRVFKEEEVDALAGEAGAADARAKEALDSARAALRGGAADVTIVSLENFDGIGRYRLDDNNARIDPRGSIGSLTFVTPCGLKSVLASYAS